MSEPICYLVWGETFTIDQGPVLLGAFRDIHGANNFVDAFMGYGCPEGAYDSNRSIGPDGCVCHQDKAGRAFVLPVREGFFSW